MKSGIHIIPETTRFFLRDPARRRKLILPLFLNLLAEVVIIALVAGFVGRWLNQVFPEGAGFTILAVVLVVATIILGMVGWVFIFTAVTGIIGGPFYGTLVEEALSEKGLKPRAPHILRDAWQAIVYLIQLVGFFIILQLLFLLLNIVPVLGTGVAAIGSLFLGVLFVAMEMFGETFALLNYRFMDRVRFVFRHFGHTMAFALPIFFLLTIPVVNVFVAPIGMVGAARLYADLKNSL